jgi:DNA repair protein RadC
LSIKNLPNDQRPREKLLQQGADALTPAELLAVILRVGIKGKSAITLGEELLTSFGGLSGLLMADVEDLKQVKGLGTAKAAQLAAVLGLATRHYHEVLNRGDKYSNAKAVAALLKTRLAHETREVFMVLFLDNQNRYLALEKLFFGTLRSAEVHPREIAKKALNINAANVILAHNHPSGLTEPSQADIQITGLIQQALALLDIKVLDHFIIGDGEPTSMRERGVFHFN